MLFIKTHKKDFNFKGTYGSLMIPPLMTNTKYGFIRRKLVEPWVIQHFGSALLIPLPLKETYGFLFNIVVSDIFL